MAKTQEQKTPYRFLLPLALGTMMNPLNSTMLATALVQLCNSYHVSTGEGAVLITSLYITSAIAQPFMGRLADMISAKKINLLGFVLVLIAALIGVFAPNLGWLVVSRVILGLGTSAAYPSAMALINKRYAAEGKQVPGNVLGLVAMSSQVSMVLGPSLGGLLTQLMGWKGVFFINIPWTIVAILLSGVIPDYPVNPENQKGSLYKRLDIPGIALFSGFLLSLLYLLMQPGFSVQWLIPAVVLLVALILWERNHERPFIDVRLFVTNPAISFIYIRTVAVTYILYMVLYALPQWLESVKHFDPGPTGLLMMPNSIISIICGLLVSKSKNILGQNVAGAFALLIASAALFFLHGNSGLLFIICVTIATGAAEGINLVANQALLNQEAPAAQKGVSFGLARTFGYLGAITSGSQLKVVFHTGVTDEKFHALSGTVIYSCLVLLLLIIPLVVSRRRGASR